MMHRTQFRARSYLLRQRLQQRLDKLRQRRVAVVDRHVARQRTKRLDERLVEQRVRLLTSRKEVARSEAAT